MPALFADPRFLEHRTGRRHPECPERLRFLYERLSGSELERRFERLAFEPATREQISRIHDPGYIDEVREFAEKGGGQIESDTVMSERSFEIACLASGAAIAAVDYVLAAPSRRATCLVRPPGHHCLHDAPMGFCLFNNVAVAAAHARAKHELDRVLIVDWDVHHGNGTQDVFYRDPNIYFFSMHRSPFYPGTGDANETGAGPGLGTTFNLPLAFGTSRRDLLSRFETMLRDAAERCKPQLVLLSAGFDAHRADPIGSLGLETEDYEPLTSLVVDVANQHAQGRLVSLLEGGYNIEKLAESVECHLKVVSGR